MAETTINFEFSGMLGDAYDRHNFYDVENEYDRIEQTINGFFSLNDAASNDLPGNVAYSKYNPLVAVYASPLISYTTSSSLLNNGATTNYVGISGVVDYLYALSTARNYSRQLLGDLIYDFSVDGYSVSVSAVYTGIESLNSNFSFQTFFGTRHYELVWDDSCEGWKIVSVVVVRETTRPADYRSVDSYGVSQTVLSLFALNDAASNDLPANVVSSNYAPLISAVSAPFIAVRTSSPLVNNGAPTSFYGIDGVVDYLHTISIARNSSTQILSDLFMFFSDDGNVASASATYTGIESLNSDSSYQTFYGNRNYALTRDPSGEYGWLITSVIIDRTATRPSPSNAATYRAEIEQVIQSYFNLNDVASADDVINVNVAKYGPLVAPYITSNLTISSSSPLTGPGVATYGTAADGIAPGATAAVAYLNALSSSQSASGQSLSGYDISFNGDMSSATGTVHYSGWERLVSTGAYDTFYGTRTYTVVRGDDGMWRIDSVAIVRQVTFAATLSS